METFDKLIEWFVRNGGSDSGGKAIVALSGGVDSAVAALAAKKALGDGAIAITADYKTLAEEELTMAWQVAKEIGIEHKV
ncbi:MAG TPA: 7-cyano-7-deazaguanine synthase, partial [Nitrososphaera sp.]|nr:7-cyano-7-deazaguanine synthase [Nitrososphaera sp.]